jgi:hypothetical protein
MLLGSKFLLRIWGHPVKLRWFEKYQMVGSITATERQIEIDGIDAASSIGWAHAPVALASKVPRAITRQ